MEQALYLSLVTKSLVTGFNTGGDERIRTSEGLLTLNGLANRRLQPLGHISDRNGAKLILVCERGLSRRHESMPGSNVCFTLFVGSLACLTMAVVWKKLTTGNPDE